MLIVCLPQRIHAFDGYDEVSVLDILKRWNRDDPPSDHQIARNNRPYINAPALAVVK